jgi:hypothetical protein
MLFVLGTMQLTRASILAALAATVLAAAPAPAVASGGQVSIIDDGPHLLASPSATLNRFRVLGAQMVRVVVFWSQIAPDWSSTRRPRNFDAADPAAYPASHWAPWDAIVRDAAADGIAVDFTVSGGTPRWADGPGMPSIASSNPMRTWLPDAREFGLFMRALGTRYSGTYIPPGQTKPLPHVGFWAIWNEPNFGEDLAPQAIEGSRVSVAPMMFRNLVNQGWSALQATGHTGDTIIIGELAARGLSAIGNPKLPGGFPGDFAQTKPLRFIRTLYCVDSSYHELRGAAARAVGCPQTAAASQRFRARNPALFDASGFSDHPYPQNLPPNQEASKDPDFAAFSELPRMERELDLLQAMYGSPTRFPIYNTEYGYITNPPNIGRYVSPATAAYYINWAEYLSWKTSRIRSTMQYLLYDPTPSRSVPESGGFASGLLFSGGRQKPTYNAYRLPLYLPVTTAARGHSLEVWGCVRPAAYALIDTGGLQTAQIEFAPAGSSTFTIAGTVTLTSQSSCYFDVHLTFPGSGTVRLQYTYPANDPVLLPGYTEWSRSVAITIH